MYLQHLLLGDGLPLSIVPSHIYYAWRSSSSDPPTRQPSDAVLGRNYTRGLVFFRTKTYGYDTSAFYNFVPVTLRLDSWYRRVFLNGTLGPLVDEVTIAMFEGVVLEAMGARGDLTTATTSPHTGTNTPAGTASTGTVITTALAELRFSGSQWGAVLGANYSGVLLTVMRWMASSLNVPDGAVRIVRMSEGSLVVVAEICNTTHDAVSAALLSVSLRASLSPLETLYQAVTQDMISLQLLEVKPVSGDDRSNTARVTIVAVSTSVGMIVGLALLGLVLWCWFHQAPRRRPYQCDVFVVASLPKFPPTAIADGSTSIQTDGAVAAHAETILMEDIM
jgi:hypothetical protein